MRRTLSSTRFARSGLALVLVLLGGIAGHGQAGHDRAADSKSLNLAAYAELLRSDVRAEKVAILTEVMGFTEAEDTAFWPIYREYNVEMARLGDQRMALIADYGKQYDTLTDAGADGLAKRALELEASRQALKSQYYDKVKTALSPRTALRFLQVEQQLLLIIDLQISSSLPIAPVDTRPVATKR